METVAVIPARGGSKGIPRKNMRLMGGKPLIAYAIENALSCDYIDEVIVSSDSEEILSFAATYEGVTPLNRDSALAQDAVTLDPVIYDAVVRRERELGREFDTVVTLQPTSPLLTVETLSKALEEFASSDLDTMVSSVNAPHLSWTKDETGKTVPNYKARLNRQQLPPEYHETGAFVIARRDIVTESTRFGARVGVYEVPEVESTDIDTKQDWIVCESLLARKKIAFRVDGYGQLGLGHIYRALTLAYELIEHEVVFICDSSHQEGIDKLRSAFMPVVEIDDDAELFDWVGKNKPDVFVNDCLDTSEEYVKRIKQSVGRFVTFEDLGSGARYADAVVNAIYEGEIPHHNTYTGKRYVALRDEFLIARPSEYHDAVERILVMFGGTDPLNLSKRVYDFARNINADGPAYKFDFLLGPGYKDELEADPAHGISVSRNVVRVSDHMRNADLAFSSQGRTTYELASMGVPTIVLAQNERETLHTFAQMDNGFINLGRGDRVSDEDLASTFNWLVGAKSVRREMHNLMLSNDLRSGIKRVKRIILGETI